jgi:hypothetical protein
MDVGSPTDFSETKKAFDTWLCDHVRTSIDEELLPDLWSTVSTTLIATNSSPRRRTAHFTDEERRQVKLALATFRVRLIQTFKPNKEQLHVVSQQLDYLASAVDRLNIRLEKRRVVYVDRYFQPPLLSTPNEAANFTAYFSKCFRLSYTSSDIC